MSDAPILLAGDPPLRIALRRSARAVRLSLRISSLDGRITLTLPPRVSRREAERFARDKAGWLRGHLAERAPSFLVGIGSVLPVEGLPVTIAEGPRTRYLPGAGRIEVGARVRSVPATVAAVLRTLARDRLGAASDRHSAALGRRYTRITLRDTRSRWGSCTADGALMYSWRLVMAPPDVLDYVAAHEVAHLAQMNHSPAFWAEVARLYPDYERPRGWLRQEGGALHRYRFSE